MSVTVTLEKQTHHGLLRNTERTWIAPNGHKVLVKTAQNITSKGSWAGRSYCFANVTYICECGNEFHKSGNPKKSELNNHDAWFTSTHISYIKKMIELS
jgi:hypothetical protein